MKFTINYWRHEEQEYPHLDKHFLTAVGPLDAKEVQPWLTTLLSAGIKQVIIVVNESMYSEVGYRYSYPEATH